MKKNYCLSDLTGFKELCTTELIKTGGKGNCKDSFGNTTDDHGHLDVDSDWGIVSPPRDPSEPKVGPTDPSKNPANTSCSNTSCSISIGSSGK